MAYQLDHGSSRRLHSGDTHFHPVMQCVGDYTHSLMSCQGEWTLAKTNRLLLQPRRLSMPRRGGRRSRQWFTCLKLNFPEANAAARVQPVEAMQSSMHKAHAPCQPQQAPCCRSAWTLVVATRVWGAACNRDLLPNKGSFTYS